MSANTSVSVTNQTNRDSDIHAVLDEIYSIYSADRRTMYNECTIYNDDENINEKLDACELAQFRYLATRSVKNRLNKKLNNASAEKET